MNFKLICLTFLGFIAIAAADTALLLNDGKAWTELDAAAWQKLPRAELTAKARDGQERKFSGVPLAEILKLLGAPSDQTLKGPELDRVLLVTAKDGYQVVFSLAELDASFRKQNIILADQVDGKPLSEFEGERMIVAGDDLRHSRWIRQITALVLTRPMVPAP
jgi:DMSO/TMAO reductase YedYZ molybdopterin-dependent catalytic subunit